MENKNLCGSLPDTINILYGECKGFVIDCKFKCWLISKLRPLRRILKQNEEEVEEEEVEEEEEEFEDCPKTQDSRPLTNGR